MSFLGSLNDAKSHINSVEKTPDRMATSPVLKGASSPGVSNAAAGGTMSQKRTKIKARTESLTRKYAAS